MPAKAPANETAADALARHLGAALRAIRRGELEAAKVSPAAKSRVTGFRIGVQEMTLELEKAAAGID